MAPQAEEPVVSSDPVIQEHQTPPPKERSVLDFSSPIAVIEALQATGLQKDWELHNYDPFTTRPDPNNIEDEAKRLLCLQSYNILESEKESEFDVITEEAKNLFDCPIAVISLVDMGRQWFKSIQGLDVDQTPRCVAFCAHVVKRKKEEGVLVVPDASKHPSFQDNPLVVGGPKIRFYAGAPLISPEGHMLGSLCVIDMKPHPEGLTDSEKKNLQVLAKEVVLNMIQRDC